MIVLNSLLCDGSTMPRHVMDSARRVGTSVSRSECRMISVNTSKGRIGDWSEAMLAVVEVEDEEIALSVSCSFESDWSVGSAPNARHSQIRNYLRFYANILLCHR